MFPLSVFLQHQTQTQTQTQLKPMEKPIKSTLSQEQIEMLIFMNCLF